MRTRSEVVDCQCSRSGENIITGVGFDVPIAGLQGLSKVAFVIASAARQSRFGSMTHTGKHCCNDGIATSLSLLAMTGVMASRNDFERGLGGLSSVLTDETKAAIIQRNVHRLLAALA